MQPKAPLCMHKFFKVDQIFYVENTKCGSKIKTVKSGLMLIAFGNGIKSCVSPLGGDQFEPSDQVSFNPCIRLAETIVQSESSNYFKIYFLRQP